jgi:uncharacterized protein (DUF305 family)
MHTNTKALLRRSALALPILLATACGSASESPVVASAAPEPPPVISVEPTTEAAAGAATQSELTEEDITFLQGMIPHHAQAVEMAELVAERTAHADELGGLAQAILTTQQAEIDIMNGLLESAGEDPVDPMASMGEGHGGMGSDMAMSGMMTAEDMTALEEADGEAFDGLFLEGMIMHHEGAIEAAQEVVAQEGGNADVRALAEDIIAAQEAEIAQMQAWQEEWGV